MTETANHALTTLERIRGCLLAGACGDALGAPVEFLSATDIHGRWGAAGIRDFVPAYGHIGAITDDTQMTLFTLEGLIRARVRWEEKGICSISGVVHHAYLRWLATQGLEPRCDVDRGGWLFATEALHERRAPGNTCLSALAAATAFGTVARNDSKGCGGVMRIAPVGLAASALGGVEQAFRLGADIARLTHGHPSGYLAAGHLAVVIGGIMAGRHLDEAIDTADALLAKQAGHEEVAKAVANARAAARCGASTEGLERLGEGWIAEEALAIGLYAALAAPSLEEALILAVNHGGDSDSTGAIAGHILGALHGPAAIPTRWLERLELREEIERLASDAARVFSTDPVDLWQAYPGC